MLAASVVNILSMDLRRELREDLSIPGVPRWAFLQCASLWPEALRKSLKRRNSSELRRGSTGATSKSPATRRSRMRDEG